MPIDSSTADLIRVMFHLEEGEQIGVVLRPLVDKIEEYQATLGPVANASHIDPSMLAFLALQTDHTPPCALEGLAHGDAIYSELHNRAGTFLRPGPCGWPLCSIGGRITIVNPRFVSAGEEKPVEEEPVPVAPVAATPAPVAAVAAPPAKPKTSYIAKRKISSFS